MVRIHPVVTKERVCMCERVCVCVCTHARSGQLLLLSSFGLRKTLRLQVSAPGQQHSCHPAEITFLFSWVLLIIFLICSEKEARVYGWSARTFAAAQVRLCRCPAPPLPGVRWAPVLCRLPRALMMRIKLDNLPDQEDKCLALMG